MLNAIAIILHLIAINIWLGGTFFSVMILHHAVTHLDPIQQRKLMGTVFRRFFFWIWGAMIILLTSGGWMIFNIYGGVANAPLYIILMAGFAVSMMLVFLIIYFGPFRRYRQLSAEQETEQAQRQLARIRLLSIVNMLLGICIVLVIGGGPHFLV